METRIGTRARRAKCKVDAIDQGRERWSVRTRGESCRGKENENSAVDGNKSEQPKESGGGGEADGVANAGRDRGMDAVENDVEEN